MRRIWGALIVTVAIAVLNAQQPSPESAAAAKANQDLNDELTKYDRAKVMGDLPAAVKGYEAALAKVKTQPALHDREQEVLQRLSGIYIAAQRPQDAVRVSTRLLHLREADCKPGSPRVESCADAQYGLGLAMMHASDFAGAVTQLTASVANFGKVGLAGDVEFRMTKLKERGDAESLLAAALFRAGNKDRSIAMFHRAIETLKTVASSEHLDPGTRESARKSISDAQSSLDLLEKK